MTLYTGKGDTGTTTIFGCDQKMMKSETVIEALGALDELNSLLGVCKTKAARKKEIARPLEAAQNNLFIIQAVVAGARQSFSSDSVKDLEAAIDSLEKRLPKIKSFVVSGGTELSALLDYARAVARRAERRAVAVGGKKKPSRTTLAYLNRLSSLLFALARLANKSARIEEKRPRY